MGVIRSKLILLIALLISDQIVTNAMIPRDGFSDVPGEYGLTAVTVTVGYSDSFGNPKFITNKTPLLTVTKNRLQ